MGFQTPGHSNAHAIQGVILKRLIGKRNVRDKNAASDVEPLTPFEIAKFAETWIALEHLKREMRGIPRLKPADADALLKRVNQGFKQIASVEPIDVD